MTARLLILFLAMAFSLPGAAGAGVFVSKESALNTAFPEADAFSSRAMLLSEGAAQIAAEDARVQLPSRLVNVHLAFRGEELVGYAYIDTHNVRSLPETLLIALHPDGRTRGVHLLAFHEPSQYQPPVPWLEQFDDRSLTADLSVRRGIAGLSGSTLTANAVTATVRRILAVHRTLFRDGDESTAPGVAKL